MKAMSRKFTWFLRLAMLLVMVLPLGAVLPQVTVAANPLLNYSTYLGGAQIETGRGVAADAAGNIYVVGDASAAFAGGAYKGGESDIFVAKFNPNLTGAASLVYLTFIGGAGNDYAGGIAVDNGGNAYVTGRTNSTNVQIAGGFQTANGGLYDALLVKLNTTGAIVYSTYLGGSGDDDGRAVSLDAANNPCVAGVTASPNYPVNSLAYQSILKGNTDSFITKIDTTKTGGAGLLYSTYFGGSGDDAANAISVLATAGSGTMIFLGGDTGSSDFPANGWYPSKDAAGTPDFTKPRETGGIDRTLGGTQDGFLAAIVPESGGEISLYYAWYIGGSGVDSVTGVGACPWMCAYVTGWTSTGDFPAISTGNDPTSGKPVLFQNYQGGVDSFLVRISPNGQYVYYGTFIGGSGNDYARSMTVDETIGTVLITGDTNSTNFPVKNGLQTSLNGAGTTDAFIIRLNSFAPESATVNIYSSYLGGSGNDAGYGAAADEHGGVALTGATGGGFPVSNAYHASFGGGTNDAFVTSYNQIFATVTTEAATNITATGATLNGTLVSMGTGFAPSSGTLVSFQFGTSPGTYTAETTAQQMTAPGAFNATTAAFGNLSNGTYYYRAKVTGDGLSYGAEKTLVIGSGTAPLAVTTKPATGMTYNTATLNGEITSNFTGTVNVSFEYGMTTSYGKTTTPQPMTAKGTFTAPVSSLFPNMTWHYRAKVDGGAALGVTYGADVAFNTVSDATVPYFGAKFAFVSARDGNEEVYGITPDGQYFARLTNNAAKEGWPRYLADFSKVTFTSWRDGNAEIYTMNGDGTNPVRITNNAAFDGMSDYSWNGSRIAFVSERDGNQEIYVMNADGSGQTRLTNNTFADIMPAFSPDGSKIAFASNRDGHYEIYMMDASSGAGVTRLTSTENTVQNNYPSWLNNGAQLVFSSTRDGNSELYVMDASGQNQTRITTNTVADDQPAWCPTGGAIFYTSWSSGNVPQVFFMAAMDGPGMQKFVTTNQFTNNSQGNWSRANWTPGQSGTVTPPPPPPPPAAPSAPIIVTVPPAATTLDAVQIGARSATLKGNLDNMGSASRLNFVFQYGTKTGDYAFQTTKVSMTATGPFEFDVTNLDPGTTYYYRARAMGDGNGYGAEKSFKTPTLAGFSYFSSQVSPDGILIGEVNAVSDDGKLSIVMPKGSRVTDADGNPQPFLSLKEMNKADYPKPPADSAIIGLVYDLGPDVTFSPPATLTFAYDPKTLPANVDESKLSIAFWDAKAGKWVNLVSKVNNDGTVSAEVSHFTPYAIIAKVPKPADIKTSNLTITPAETGIGEEITVSVTVTNVGDMPGDYMLKLNMDNQLVESRNTTVPGHDSQKISFTLARNTAGTGTININGLTGTFTVKAPPALPSSTPPAATVTPATTPDAPAPAAFKVSNLSISPAEVDANNEVIINAVVSNTGGLAGIYKAILKLNGTVVDSRDISLSDGASQQVSFKITADAAGKYDVGIETLTGSFEVKVPPQTIDLKFWLMVGGSVIALAVISVLLVAYRFRLFRAF